MLCFFFFFSNSYSQYWWYYYYDLSLWQRQIIRSFRPWHWLIYFKRDLKFVLKFIIIHFFFRTIFFFFDVYEYYLILALNLYVITLDFIPTKFLKFLLFPFHFILIFDFTFIFVVCFVIFTIINNLFISKKFKKNIIYYYFKFYLKYTLKKKIKSLDV